LFPATLRGHFQLIEQFGIGVADEVDEALPQGTTVDDGAPSACVDAPTG
jgi:hypothetical protein